MGPLLQRLRSMRQEQAVELAQAVADHWSALEAWAEQKVAMRIAAVAMPNGGDGDGVAGGDDGSYGDCLEEEAAERLAVAKEVVVEAASMDDSPWSCPVATWNTGVVTSDGDCGDC